MRRSATVVALALGVGLLAGCGPGDPEPTGSGSLTAGSPTPTAVETTPTELVTAVPLPVMPPEMANNDAAGAEAALRYFVELSDYVLASGDSSQWTAVTDDDCVFCQSIVDSAAEIAAGGWERRGGGLTVTSIVRTELSTVESFYFVDAMVEESAYEFVGPDGEVVESVPDNHGGVTFGVQFTGGAWTLVVAGDTESGETP